MAYESNKPKKTPCPRCGNPLRLAGVQRGEEVRCPKCNAAFTVGGSGQVVSHAPEEPAVAAPVEPPQIQYEQTRYEFDAYEPETPLDQSNRIPEEQLSPIGEQGGVESDYEVDWSTADHMEMEAPVERPPVREDVYLESARRRGMIRDEEQPDPPRWTFFSGVFGYPWRGVNVARWAAISTGLAVAGFVDYLALEMVGLLDGNLTNLAVMGLIQVMFGIIMTLAVLAFAAASCEAAIQDTANGHDAPQEDTLPDWDHWTATLVCWLMLAAVAAALGYPLSLAIGPVAMAISLLVFFPILLLSAMESDSYIMPVSAPVLRSLGSYAHGWLAFYLISTTLVVALAAAYLFGVEAVGPIAIVVLGPVTAWFVLVYARLLGRLVWGAAAAGGAARSGKTAKSRAGDKAAKNEAPKGKPGKGKKKRGRVRIVIPEDVDRRDDPPPERPRISFHHRP